MKRLFTYILALSLLPQIASAAVLVGKTEGTFALSPKGAATYTIPLTIPKGMSDFKPELSLVYDSQDGSGIMGLGWSIKGIQTISKVNKCNYLDGTSEGTAFALNGMRLLLKSGTDGQTGATYKMLHDCGDVISIAATQNGVPATFKVNAADGSIYKYGSSTGRYINGDNSKWALDYVQDALGNYISYTYDQNGGLYPTSITYGRNVHGTAGVDCVISFTYDNSTTKRLQSIECRYNGSIYRTYTFNYAESPSRLISVTEGGRGTSTFAPTSFTWAQNRIASITDGLGATENFNYGETDWIPVVVSRTESTPTDSRTTTYSYHSISYNYEGEISGFYYVEEESSTGIVTKTYNDDDSNHLALYLKKVEICNANEDIIKKDDYQTHIETASDKSYRISYAKRSSTRPFEWFYDEDECFFENGELDSRYTDDGLLSDEKHITPWLSSNDTVWIKNLPSEVNIRKNSQHFGAEGEEFEKITYERDPNTGLVLKEIKTRNDQHVKTDGYSYNVYGQVISHYTVAYESTDTLITTYQYNTKGQLYKEYNPLGQYKTYSYNTYTGTLSSVVEFDGSTTTYTYDNMLRETKCSGSSNIVTTTRSTANYGGSVYSVKVSESDKAPITTYYDAWGRKVAESTIIIPNATVYTDYQYLPNGKIGFISFPHKNTVSTGGTTYTYDDPLQRLTKTEDTNGKINTWEYDEYGRIISCIDGVTTMFQYYTPDKLNLIMDADDLTDFVQYFYTIDGNIDYIDVGYGDAGTNWGCYTTDYEYDVFGRLVQTTDVNGVTKQYEYDGNGNLWKTTVDGSSVETNYDKYGRLISKMWYGSDEGSQTVNYTYNTGLRMKHLLAQEQGDNYTYTYSYELGGKLIGKNCSVSDGNQPQSANIGIQYDSNKQISRENCTFGFASNRTFEETFSYTHGVLLADSLNQQLAYRLNNQDNWGNVTSEKAFRGTITRTFDDYGNMLSMKRLAIQKSYTYDIETGNMTGKDGVFLSYDDKNRLTEWGDHTYSYDKMGNITNLPLVGTFTYEDFKVDGMVEAAGYSAGDSLNIIYYKAIERPKSLENEHYKADFSYDGNGNRVLMKVYKKVSGQYQPYLTRYYLGEKAEVNIDSLGRKKGYLYAGNDAQTAPAVLEVQPSGSSVIWKMTRDNTESVLRYDRASVTPYYEFSYSPWGVRTSVNDDTDFTMPGESLGACPFYRTYKGYEDLWMFGLLYDKTRLYSPYLGRYLSPSPVLNSTRRAYDFNPYVFSKNNPFRVVK